MASDDNLRVLPTWKKDASVYERLSELALYAREHPERFDRFVLCYREKLRSGNNKYRTLSYGCDLDQQIGMFEIGKLECWKESAA